MVTAKVVRTRAAWCRFAKKRARKRGPGASARDRHSPPPRRRAAAPEAREVLLDSAARGAAARRRAIVRAPNQPVGGGVGHGIDRGRRARAVRESGTPVFSETTMEPTGAASPGASRWRRARTARTRRPRASPDDGRRSTGPEVAAGLLVGGGEEDQAALERRPCPLEGQGTAMSCRIRRLHVQRAAPCRGNRHGSRPERGPRSSTADPRRPRRCVMEHDGGSEPSPSSRAMRLPRPGSRLGDLARHSLGVEDPARERAPSRSLPGGLVVSTISSAGGPRSSPRRERPVDHDRGAAGPSVVQ